MEGTSGGPLGNVAVSMSNGLGNAGGQTMQLLQQHPQWAGQPFFNDFGPPQQQQGGPSTQGLHHQQLLQQQQQQQMLLAAAQAVGSAQGQQGPPGSSQQHMSQMGPTINMMLQAATQGLPHAIQSPPNSAAHGFLLLPGMGHPHQSGPTRDISPNSTPSLSGHPAQSATPPTVGDISDRTWAHTAQPNMLFGGPRMMNPPQVNDKMEDLNHHIAMAVSGANGPTGPRMNDLFHVADPFNSIGQSRQQGQDQLSLNQMQLSELAAMGRGFNQPYQYLPPHSPPHMFQQPLPPHQMPPRPRPEGGQDPSPNFFNEQNDSQQQKKDDLVIGSWNEEEVEKLPPSQPPQQHMLPPNFMMQQRPPMMDEKDTTGWGAPPPPNTSASSGWGPAPQGHVPSHPPPNQNITPPRKSNWQLTGNVFDAPPPQIHQQHTRGGRGGGRGGMIDRPPRYNNDFESRTEHSGRGRGGYRGRGGGGGPRLNVDHSQEKDDGKKRALATATEMMNKMKLEDKERKDAHRQREEKRREQNPDMENTNSDDSDSKQDESLPPRRFHDRGNSEYRGRGRGGNRGNRFIPGQGPGGLNQPGPMPPGGGLFMPPGGGIPPFPGLENLMGGPPMTFPGSYPGVPANPFYGQQFNHGFRFTRGVPNHRGQRPFGFGGPRGPFIPPMIPRGGGHLIIPRGMMAGRGVGRGAYRGQRGGKGRGGGNNVPNKSSEHLDKNGEADERPEDDRGQAEGVESDKEQPKEESTEITTPEE